MKSLSIEISRLEEEILDETIKGMPGGVAPFRLGDIASHGWNVANEDLPLPLLTLRRSAVEHNIALMQRYCDARGAALAPHGKTTMAPQIFKWQLDAGAWGITAATLQQLQVYRSFGVQQVIFANQLVDCQSLAYVCRELRDDERFECYVFVDSPEGVRAIAAAAREHGLGRRVEVLLEIGHAEGRAGVRTLSALERVWRAIREEEGAAHLAGVTGFEGLLAINRFETGRANGPAPVTVESYLKSVVESIDGLKAMGALDDSFLVTAGGSAAFDHVLDAFADRRPGSAQAILRSGCYVTHDHHMYANTSPLRGRPGWPSEDTLRPALELWSYVQSRPEPTLAILTFGRRDAPYDYGLPVPIAHLPARSLERREVNEWSVVKVNDQHAYLAVPAEAEVEVGDRVVCGISHPCTAFDKWRVIPLLDDADTVIGAIRTFF
jgi:D-serine dehydratase